MSAATHRRDPAAAVRRFALAPADARPLGVLRIAICAIGLLQVALLWPHLLQLYGNFGFVQWAIMETGSDTWLPSIGKLAIVLGGLGVSTATAVQLVFGVYAVSLLGLLVGWHTRAWAWLAWATHTLTVNSGYISLYGVDTMLHIALFYFLFMPVGDALSLDARRRGRSAPTAAAGLSLRVLQLHLCIIYVNTGLAKAIGEQWWTGEALWRALMQPQFSVFDYSWLAGVAWLPLLAGWSVIVLELGYAVAIWPRRTRAVWLAGVVALHAGIALLMGLWLFSAVMIALNVCAFGWTLAGQASTTAAPARATAHRPAPAPA